VERYRGLDFQEDLLSPFEVHAELEPGQELALVYSTQDRSDLDARAAFEAEAARRAEVVAAFEDAPEVVQQLVRAADQFVVRRGTDHRTIVAGYHWFGDWGRDAMIALPGVCLATGKTDEARQIIETFLRHRQEGLIPNRFPDGSEPPSYNTADATLWLFQAVRRYLYATADWDYAAETLYPALVDILEWHLRGTRNAIGVTEDGLLTAGTAETQLTWMDAKVDDWVVTPRHGKAVELNALWYNALRVTEYIAKKLGNRQDARRWSEVAARAKAAFVPTFWSDVLGYLYDCVSENGPDRSLRPNQIFAVALPYELLSKQQSAAVLDVVTQHLLTPYGLRTLSRDDPRYEGMYGGDQRARDGAYHQGTVWPWLLGPYFNAYFAVHGRNRETKAWAREFLKPLGEHLAHAGLGSVSEIFDGDPPHHPRGCIAQAWSVGELLRVWTELLR